MKDGIMISITCVTYNHKEYIRDMFEGILAQKTQYKYELIVHDDASTDGTTDIVREYACKYPDIIIPLIEEENQYSRGVDIGEIMRPYVRGRFVANCDGDDYWIDPFKLQKQVDYLLRHPKIIAVCTNARVWDWVLYNRDILDRDGYERIKARYDGISNEGKEDLYCSWKRNHKIGMEDFLEDKPIIKPSTWMIRNATDEQNKIIMKLGGTTDFCMRAYMMTQGKVYYMADVTTVYRVHTPGSWTYNYLFGKSEYKTEVSQGTDSVVDTLNEITEYKYDKLIQKKRNSVIYRKLNCERNMELLKVIGITRIVEAGCLDIAIATFLYKFLPGIYGIVRKLWRQIIGEKNC